MCSSCQELAVVPKSKSNLTPKPAVRNTRAGKTFNCRREGTKIVWPAGVCARYGISAPTRWRWERGGKLPPRDVYVSGEAVGWRPETLDAADRGEIPAAA
jgi:predicted DNA-binding transcriptional regulator AlpA